MAGQKIKGITIEIGGETKELNRALKDVGKESKSIQNELKQVEKALKLDPTNTELLRQKQELLAKSVETTKKNLHALQAEQDKVFRANANNEAWTKAYEPLKAALDETQKKLKKLMAQDEEMKQNLSSGKISDTQYTAFQKTLSDTQDEAKRLTVELRKLDDKFEDGHISDEGYRDFQRTLIKMQAELQDLEREAANSNVALQNLSAHAKEAGDAFDTAAQKTENLSDGAKSLIEAAIDVVSSTKEMRGDLGRLETNAQQVGISLDTVRGGMETLSAISDETDSNVEALSNLLATGFNENQLVTALDAVAGAYVKFPDTIKVESLADSLQETIATGAATGQFAELLGRLGFSVETFNAQMNQAGQSGLQLDYVVNFLACSGLSESYDAFVRNNGALVESNRQATQFQQTMADLGNILQPLINDIMQPLIEILQMVVEWLGNLSPETKKCIANAILLVAVISPLLNIISNIFKAISTVTTGIGALGKAASLFSGVEGMQLKLTILAIVTAVTLLVTAIASLINALGNLKNAKDRVNISGGGRTDVRSSGGVRAYAGGTDYHPGGWALVGEQGAELLRLPRGARVYSHRETERMLTPVPASGGDTFQISVNVQSLSDMEQLLKLAKDARRMERMGTVKA